jgi:hypothetical protein
MSSSPQGARHACRRAHRVLAGCTGSGCTAAIADGTYPYVFNNDQVDGSFGVTSPIFLDELTPWGQVFNRIAVPTRDIVTSFSSKSELALNLSTNGQDVTFMGYQAPVAAVDVSNSNTPGVIDPTNPVTGADYRVVADLGRDGSGSFTLTNAYSGNNGRAAILNNAPNVIYTAGNAGNAGKGSNPQPNGVILGHGAAVIAGDRRPAEHHRPRQPERDRDDLGHHLDRERKRRPGRGSEQARRDHRPSSGDDPGRRDVPDTPHRALRRGAPRRVVPARNRLGPPLIVRPGATRTCVRVAPGLDPPR